MLIIFGCFVFATGNVISLKGIFTNTASFLYTACQANEDIHATLLARKKNILKEKVLNGLEAQIKIIEETVQSRFRISNLRQILRQSDFTRFTLLRTLATPMNGSAGVILSAGGGLSASFGLPGTFSIAAHTSGERSSMKTHAVRTALPKDELNSESYHLLEPYIEEIKEIELRMHLWIERLKCSHDLIFNLEQQYLEKKKELPEELQSQIEDELIASYDTDGQMAARTTRFLQEATVWPTHVKPVMLNPEVVNNHYWMKALTPEQQAEIWEILTLVDNNSRAAHSEQISIFYIYGPPGSGKTKTIDMILELLGLPNYRYNLIKGSKAFASPAAILGQSRRSPFGENGWFVKPFFQRDQSGKSCLNPCLLLDDIKFDETNTQFFQQYSVIPEVECPYFGALLDPRNMIVFMTSNDDIHQQRDQFAAFKSRITHSVCFSVGDQTKAQIKYVQEKMNAYLEHFPTKHWSLWETRDFLDFTRFAMETDHEAIDHRSLLNKTKKLANAIYNPHMQFLRKKQEIKRLLDLYEQVRNELHAHCAFVGRLYRDQSIVDIDDSRRQEKAFQCFDQAIALGHQEVFLDLGITHVVHHNPAAAVTAYQHAYTHFEKLATEESCPDSAYELGHMHEHSRGVPENKEEALRWYSKAATQMEPRAIAAQERLKTLLRPTPLPELPVTALPEQAIAAQEIPPQLTDDDQALLEMFVRAQKGRRA